MSDKEAQPGTNSIAGNTGAQPEAATTKMGADAQNTNANSTAQPTTIDAGLPSGQAPAPSEPNAAVPHDPATVPGAAAPTSDQPDSYGGNFGNDVQGSYNDPNRASNQTSAPDRGAFGQQQYNQGNTHGGYGNQYREFDPAAQHPAAEATEERYYGEGASRSGPQHNSYSAYDGHDRVPDQQGQAIRDTQPVAAQHPGNAPAATAPPTDNRNLPGRDDQGAAFQNDNGSPTTGGGYADDYGHTSGVGLPAATPDNHHPTTPGAQNQRDGQPSTRGGYDGTPPSDAPGAPAPVNAPDAPQTEGYGYGHERSEEAVAGDPKTGDSRSGFGPGGSKEGDTSQGHGSQGGSYDDENPGARGPGHDNFTQQDKAQNYGQDQRADFRPADGDHPTEGDHGPTPRRNPGRDE
ncbi:MAG: hypothetical protein ACRYFX_30685 [Janthinobacterium lividum]